MRMPPNGSDRRGGNRPEGGRKPRHTDNRSLEELSVTVWLTPENALFFRKNGLLWMKRGETEIRVTLCREFPFELPWEYISVLDEESHEVGIIRDVHTFGEEQCALLVSELQRRYYAPVIKKIVSVKERYGFSYWKVCTEEGDLRFTLHDTYRSILHVNQTRLIFTDVNGNRFEIPDVSLMDQKSQRKLELYL